MAETMALYKLLILYLLDRVDFPMTNAQICEFILEKGYTNYFKLQEVLREMQDCGYLQAETTYNRTLYHLTEEGRTTLHYFKSHLSPAIREDVDAYLQEKAYSLKQEVAVRADFYRNEQHLYEVHLQLLEEGASLLELRLTVPTETEARAMTDGWNKGYQEIYKSLLTQLLKPGL